MAAPEKQQIQGAERSKRRLPVALAGMFSAVVLGFAIVAVLLWIFVR
jgi:multisubunit Na+/H+ antiporter MnhC subunit